MGLRDAGRKPGGDIATAELKGQSISRGPSKTAGKKRLPPFAKFR